MTVAATISVAVIGPYLRRSAESSAVQTSPSKVCCSTDEHLILAESHLSARFPTTVQPDSFKAGTKHGGGVSEL